MPMTAIVDRALCSCLRCGHVWMPDRVEKPRSCAKCKSKVWDRPRKGIILHEPRRPAEPKPPQSEVMARAGRLGNVFRALETLAALDIPKFMEEIHPWQAPDVDPYLETAGVNLAVLKEAWDGRNRP